MKYFKFIVVLLIIVNVASCSKEEAGNEKTNNESAISKSDKKIVARVNGQPVYEVPNNTHGVDYLVGREILRQEAIKLGIDQEIEQDVISYKRNRLIDKLRSRLIVEDRDNNPPTQEEIDEKFELYKKDFTGVKTLEFQIDDKARAEEILNSINSSENKAAAVDLLKKDDTITVRENPTTKLYNNKFELLEVGEISGISEKDGKYNIYYILEVNQLPRDKTMQFVLTQLRREKSVNVINDFIDEAKKNGNYEIEIVN